MRILKTFFLLGLGILLRLEIQGQVIINEISYNSPESGTDSLEYIELYNAGIAMVNIGGWHFLAGVEDTFPNVQLEPGGYFVTAVSAQAMMNVFGIAVHEWSGGALSNNGEPIKIVDAGGNLIDSLLYDDANPWPTEADGNGPSLELVNASLDNNDGTNWQFSGGTTGVIINGFEVSGTPGAKNSGGGTPGPAVTISVIDFRFDPKNVVVKIGDVVRWVCNTITHHNVDGLQDIFPGNPEAFFSGVPVSGPWQFDFTFALAGLNHYQCDLHGNGGMVGTVSVYDPNAYTDFPLPHLRLTDGTNGTHLFNGVPTTVTGVVHGVNFQPTGYSFYIIDENNVGINVFSFDPGAYVVTEGDRVKVSGVIDVFNGLLEIVPDAIEVLSSGNALNTPRSVSNLTELDESSYLYLEELLVDSVGSISATGFNVYATHTNGSKILVRVDADANTGTIPDNFPEGEWLYVWRGIGTQFDNSFPFTAGYQVLALDLGVVIDGIQPLENSVITMEPNPANDLVHLNSELNISNVEIYSMDGKRLLRKQVNGTNTEVDINLLPAGMHMVKAYTDQGVWTSLLSVVK